MPPLREACKNINLVIDLFRKKDMPVVCIRHMDEKESTPSRADLPPAAQRALAEAEERRRKAKAAELPTELGGRDGPEPVRYGDWEMNGLAVDF